MLYLILLLIVMVFYFFGNDIRHRWFAFLMNKFQDPNNKTIDAVKLKKDLFTPLGSLESHIPALRSKKSIKILEIGVGTGTNFEYYPNGTQLIVIDPNPHFAKYYNENRKKFENISSEEIIVTTGEEMDVVPDESVDAVVVTLVLCSVTSIKAILRQVKRVLVPGGKFLFMEHVVEFDESHSTRRKLQNLLSDSGLWPFLMDGCRLNRTMTEAIDAAGFSAVDYKHLHAPVANFVLQLVSPHLVGVATK